MPNRGRTAIANKQIEIKKIKKEGEVNFMENPKY